MDSPSVFGAILDRDAGMFRLGPADVHVPAARRYLPGTMILETSWGTRGGWIIVRDVLLIGPWHHSDDRSHTHRRAPTDYDADHVLLRTVRCVNGEVQLALVCEPAFDYGRDARPLGVRRQRLPRGASSRAADVELRLTTDLNLGFEGPRATARAPDQGGRAGLLRAVVERAPGAAHVRRGLRAARLDRPPLAALARPRRVPRPPVALATSSAARSRSRASPTRRPARSSPPPPRRCPRRPGGERNWDYRYTWIRDATFALWGLYTLGFDWEANDFFYFVADVRRGREGPAPDHVRHRRPRRAARGDARPPVAATRTRGPVRIGNGAHDQDQHDVWGAVLDSVYLHTKSRDRAARARVADPQAAGRGGDRQLARARPRHLGGARRPEALHLVEAHVLGRARPRRAARRAARGLGPGDAVAGGRRRDPRRHLRARARRARRLHPALRHRRRSTRRCC